MIRAVMRNLFGKNLLPVLSGLLLGLSFPSFHVASLAWVALVPLFYSSSNVPPREGFWRFWLAGTVFYAFLLQWLLANVYWAGGWAVVGYALLAAIMGLYWGLLGTLWTWCNRRGIRPGNALLLGLLWVTMEFLQANLFTGFGWGALAYSQGKNPWVIQWASLGGTGAIAFFMVLFSGLVALGLRVRPRRYARLAVAFVVLAVALGGGYAMVGDAQYGEAPFVVGLFQSNFPQKMKWDPEYTAEMIRNAADKSRRLARNRDVDLFVWPEALIMEDSPSPQTLEVVRGLTQATGASLFTGSTRFAPETNQSYNAGLYFDEQGNLTDYYDKIHLAPFGEYAPLSNVLPIIGRLIPAIGAVDAGTEPKVFDVQDRRFGPLICFEVLFPAMTAHLREEGADFLVVITNLGWFGATGALGQELEVARLRAVESRLPLVHCANTGISGVFDPWGNLTGLTQSAPPEHTAHVRLTGALPLAQPGQPLLAKGPVVFPWLAVALAVMMTALAQFPARETDFLSRTRKPPS